MKRAIFLSIVTAGLALTLPAPAAANINDAQTCQALLEFAGDRVASVKAYPRGDVKTIRKGLSAYDDFLQSTHVTPNLKSMTSGDKAAMKTYQTQIDAYKAQLVKTYEARFTQDKIFMDQVMAINNCYTKMPMAEKDKPVMTRALETMMKLAQS